MIQPDRMTESAALTGFLSQAIDSARAAAHGLTEEQARLTPTRSALSIGGVLKHLTIIGPNWQRREESERGERGWELTEEDATRFYGSFALTEDETLEGVLAAYDESTTALLAAIKDTDPDADVMAPPAPWFGRTEPSTVSARVLILHLIDEFARHAGHADVIREQIDAAQALPLTMAIHDMPANDFVAPWEPGES